MRLLITLSLLLEIVLGADFSFHSTSSSMYVHSNDTLTLALAATRPNVLIGPPGSSVDLEFVLTYHGYSPDRIFLTQASEDNFRGTLEQNQIMLSNGQQQSIWVRRMIVPQRKNGMKVRFALTASLGSSRKKREQAPTSGNNPPTWSGNNPGGPVGGSGYNPGGSVGGSGYNPGGSVGGSGYNPGGSVGGSGYNPGGSVGGSSDNPGNSGYNPEDSVGGSGYNPGGSVGGSGYNPGGSVGGSGYNPGGSGYNPGGSVGGSGYNPGGSIGGSGFNPGGSGGSMSPPDWNYQDPSYKREVTTTVEFTVTTEPESDDSEPEIDLEYGADDEDELCINGPGVAGCELQYWYAKFKVEDQESGLHVVKVVPEGKEMYQHPIYYRYVNFPIGTNVEQEVIGAASCCTSGMKLQVTNVAGRTAELTAEWDGTGGSGLSRTVIYAIIGGVLGVLVIVGIIVGVVCYRNKYSAVSQNP